MTGVPEPPANNSSELFFSTVDLLMKLLHHISRLRISLSHDTYEQKSNSTR